MLTCLAFQIQGYAGKQGHVKKQKRMSSYQRGSVEFRKRRRIFANTYRKMATADRNECRRITSELVKQNDIIAIEDLKTQKITKKSGRKKPD